MRTFMLAAVMAASLALAGDAWAGCWATAGVSPLPTGVAPGETWAVDVRILQHARTPLADATPKVLITNGETGETRSFRASMASAGDGLYRAHVVFPTAGAWSVAVYDGFPWAECARTHTFGTFSIGAGSTLEPPAEPVARAVPPDDVTSSTSLWVALGAGLGASLASVSVIAIRRGRRTRTPVGV
jgi:hypothetical protein